MREQAASAEGAADHGAASNADQKAMEFFDNVSYRRKKGVG